MFNFHRYDNNTKCVNKLNPRRVLYESKGDTIVSLMYAAAEGDMGNLRRFVALSPLHPYISGHLKWTKDINSEAI